MTHPLANRSGFSLLEMILAVMVMTILIGATVPGVYEFIKMRDKQREEVSMEEVKKALQAYIAAKGEVPAVTEDWSGELAGYSKLSANKILNDTWGHPRRYVSWYITQTINNLPVVINYASVHSMGPDGTASTGVGIGIEGNAFATAVTTSCATATAGCWWRNTGGDVTRAEAFRQMKVADDSDDIMLKFNDYPEKLQGVTTTSDRLNKITGAFETYARGNYASYVNYCAGTNHTDGESDDPLCNGGLPEKVIYGPYGQASSQDKANYFDPTKVTGNYIVSATNLPTDLQIANDVSDTIRRTNIVKLMRTLGLPDDFCCSAIDTGGDSLPKPFYYYSNPRKTLTAGCGVRSQPGDSKLPPRVTTLVPACD